MKHLFTAAVSVVFFSLGCGGQDAVTLVPAYSTPETPVEAPSGGGFAFIPQPIPVGDFIEGPGYVEPVTAAVVEEDAGTPLPTEPQCVHAEPKGKAKGWHRVCGR